MLIHVNTGIYTCFYMQKRHCCRVELHLNSASPRQSRIRRPNIWRIYLFSTSQSLEMTQSPLFNARKKWQDLEVNFYTTWYHMLYIYDCLNQACFADIGQEAEVGSSGFWRLATLCVCRIEHQVVEQLEQFGALSYEVLGHYEVQLDIRQKWRQRKWRTPYEGKDHRSLRLSAAW